MTDYILKEVATREENDVLMDLAFQVWNRPHIVGNILPIQYGPFQDNDFKATMAVAKERDWNMHINDPASHKVYVVYVPSGEVVGSVFWKIYTTVPFPNGPQKIQLSFWPQNDKEGKECGEEILNQCFFARANWMNRPMVAMDATSVRDDHQRKGVGSLLISWGVQKADDLGVECFVEASDAGKHLYKKFGYIALTKIIVDAENGTKQRSNMIEKLIPGGIHYWAMWRPKGGMVKDGAPQTLWDAMVSGADHKE